VVVVDIILIRHGSTAWNERYRFRGLANIDLDETGKKQAEATIARLAKLPVSLIFSSIIKSAVNVIQRQKDQFYAILLNDTCHLIDINETDRNHYVYYDE
jgi:bisphosphoglycerate-dependent phosphoglycerate mutase